MTAQLGLSIFFLLLRTFIKMQRILLSITAWNLCLIILRFLLAHQEVHIVQNQCFSVYYFLYFCECYYVKKKKSLLLVPVLQVFHQKYGFFKSIFCIFPLLCRLCGDIVNKYTAAAISTPHTNENHGINSYYCTPSLFTINS